MKQIASLKAEMSLSTVVLFILENCCKQQVMARE